MIETLRKTWALLSPAERRKALPMLVLVVLMAAAETAGVVSIMPFLSLVARPAVVEEHAWLSRLYGLSGATDTRDFTFMLGIGSILAVVLSSAFKTITLHLVHRYVFSLRHSISSRLLSRYLHQPYRFFLDRNPAELSKNVLSEADQLTFNLIQPLAMLMAQGMVVLAMTLLIVLYDPWMALGILSVVATMYGLIYLLVRGRLRRIGMARRRADTGRYQACNESLGGIKDVQITQSEGSWLERYSRHSRTLSRHMATAETLSTSPLYIVEALGFTGLVAIALVLLTRNGDLAEVLPALGLYGFAAYRLLPAVQIIYRGFARLRYSSASLDKVHEDLSLSVRPRPPEGGMLAPRTAITLVGVTYSYPSAPNRPVLQDVSLRIPANSCLGITGASGSGKSTLMDILLGLLPPDRGTLLIDDTPVIASNVADWQRAIGYISQHIYLADASVAQNIAFGVPPEKIDMAAVKRAARTAQVDAFVESELSDSYDTNVGDRGVRLSGGQRQRIGIARALYRDPPVLFMDEATSALDDQTELAFNEAIRSLAGRKTIVVIAHKESSLRYCDRVVVLGSHGRHE